MSKILSIRVGEEQEKILGKFAESEGKSVSQFVRDTVYEKIEEETDIRIFNDRKNAEDRDQELSKDLDTVIEEFGL